MPVIQGKLSDVDKISQNGYRYKPNFWEKALSNPVVQERIKNRDMLGMIEHPLDDAEYLNTPYEKASHVVLKAWVDPDSHEPYGQFGLLNNEHGNAIKALLDVGHMPGVSTRGLGDYSKDSVSSFVSDENYVLLTWDLVRCPNFNELKMEKVSDSLKLSPAFVELLQMYHVRDSVDESIDKVKLVSDIKGLVSGIVEKLKLL